MGFGVTWLAVAASEVGTSHVAIGKACEDSCWAQADVTASGQPILSIFVSDGAGSASHGGAGAELAITAAAKFLENKLALAEFGLSDEFAVECCLSVREQLFANAETSGLLARDFACTFLGVICSNQATLVMQIGDGGVVVDVGNGLEVPVVPMAGEYANMTHFVTDEDAVITMVTRLYPAPATRVAAFSDGIQRLALNMATNTAHEPFFEPFFNVLATVPTDKEEQLQDALIKFLGSDAVNERTDDDKTLALAVRNI